MSFTKKVSLNLFKLEPLLKSRVVVGAMVWGVISVLLFLKIPSAFTKIYAEDGAVALQVALTKSFPGDILTPVAGYSDLILRFSGRFVSLFPLSMAASAFFFFNTLLLTCLFVVIYQASASILNDKVLQLLLSTSLILIPIGTFESIGNSANLHFYFMAACLPIFIAKSLTFRQEVWFGLFVFIATTSIPLMAFYIPLILFMLYDSRKGRLYARLRLPEIAFLLGLVYQFAFIFAEALGDRSIVGLGSMKRVLYLYLDRVVGSSLVPWWGNVSSGVKNDTPNFLSTQGYLFSRAMIASALLILLLVLIKKMVDFDRRISIVIFLSGHLYWFTIGFLFSPEPRYAILPSFGLIFILLIFNKGQSQIWKIRGQIAISCVLIATWSGSWDPAPIRVNGPTWVSQFQIAQKECAKKLIGEAEIRIIPMNSDWNVKINCNKLKLK